MENQNYWIEKTKLLEDRLSDRLHEELTKTFIDKRASILARGLKQEMEFKIEILENNTLVKITHTLTSAFCPMADEINQNIQKAGMVEGIKKCIANCTFQPPFSMDMVPEETKMAMGWT